VGPTHFYLWDPQLKFMFSHPVSEKTLTTIFIPNFISKLYYLIFSLRFFQLQTTSQIILLNIFHRICVLTSSKIVLSKLYIYIYDVNHYD
jgi:hypothetical protein